MPDKKYFDIKIECNMPATITYRIFAEDAEEALDMIKNQAPTNVKYNIFKRTNIKATIYDAGTSLIRFVKRFG